MHLYKVGVHELSNFYNFYLRHYLEDISASERNFHIYVSNIVSVRIAQLKFIDPFSKIALRAKRKIERLKAFQKFLASVDQWNSSKALEAVIAKNNKEIFGLKQEITDLKSQLQVLREFEPSARIDIRDEQLLTFVHLIHQLQHLILPDERRLFNFQWQSGRYKLVSKYFKQDRSLYRIRCSS